MQTDTATELWQTLMIDADNGAGTLAEVEDALRADRSLDGEMVVVGRANGVVARGTLRFELLRYAEVTYKAHVLRVDGDVTAALLAEGEANRIYRRIPADWRW